MGIFYNLIVRHKEYLLSLGNPGQLTVFAPSNRSFVDLSVSLGFGSMHQFLIYIDANGLAETLLAGHIIPERKLYSGAFSDGLRLSTLGSQSNLTDITVRVTNGGRFYVEDGMQRAEIVETDLAASNGVLHVIGKVRRLYIIYNYNIILPPKFPIFLPLFRLYEVVWPHMCFIPYEYRKISEMLLALMKLCEIE